MLFLLFWDPVIVFAFSLLVCSLFGCDSSGGLFCSLFVWFFV